MAQVLRDPVLDRQLARDGFAVVPTGDEVDLDALRAAYDGLDTPLREGFVADLMVADPEYRRNADSIIAEHTHEAVCSRFVGHEPFMYSFLCKHPGPNSDLYLHQDWMYVDERSGESTYVAWLALVDVTGHNGQLRALRGSHRMDPSLRGTGANAEWLQHVDVIDENLVSIPARAGDIVVMNNALVHSSFPNNTAEPRLVAATGMRREGVPLVHFLRQDDTTVLRYDIDETFFHSYTPQQLLETSPDLPVRERIDEKPSRMTEAELRTAIKRLRRDYLLSLVGSKIGLRRR